MKIFNILPIISINLFTKRNLLASFIISLLALHCNLSRAEEIIYVPALYHAWWDGPYSGHSVHENAFGATPQEACEAVLAQNPEGIQGYTYSHYMDDNWGRRCAIKSPNIPDYYSRIWISYPHHLCPANSSYSTSLEGCVCWNGFFVEGQSCTPPTISINGASSTRALPSLVGPITQKISITHNGLLKKSIPFNLTIQESPPSTLSTVSGITNENGFSEFEYVPPYYKNTQVTLTATCATCSNSATKIISVSTDEDPQMCRRQ